jgi:arylsulfatase A-like enzyme
VAVIRLLACGLMLSAAAVAQKPNFVVILVDDLGYGDLGAYGSKTIRTPRLDRMAREGVRFTSFYAGAPFCSPSRAALLTGRYPIRAGVPNVLFPTETTGLPTSEVTLAELLKPAGYATAAIGKWHLGYPKELRAQRQGFDFFYGLPYSNDMYKVGPDEEFRAQHARWELPLLHDEEVLEAPVEQHTLTERYTERALDFIRTYRERPFLLYLPHTFPHSPLYAAKDREGRSPHGLYADVVEELDESTGRILDLLAELGIAERTLVIFTSDNGSHETPSHNAGRFGLRGAGGDNGPLRGRKGNTFEGGVRVPGIFWMPGKIGGGRTSDAVATAMDILPTVAEIAGVDLPKGRKIDGKSLAPYLLDKRETPEEQPYFYYFGGQLQAVRVGHWKLFLAIEEYPERPPSLWYQLQPDLFERHYRLLPASELYNLDDDIGETRNVAADHPEIVQRLTRVAESFDKALQPDKAAMVP